MLVYNILLSVVLLFFILKEQLPRLRWLDAFAILILSLFSGFRYMVGFDWEAYYDEYGIENIGDVKNFYDCVSYVFYRCGQSFYVFSFFIYGLIYINFRFAVGSLLFFVFLIFLITDDYFFWGFNGIRQYLAMSFLFVYVSNRTSKYYRWLSLFLSVLTHSSTLFFYVVYFITHSRKGLSKRLLILLVLFLLFLNNGVFRDSVNTILFGTYLNYLNSRFAEIDINVVLGLGFYFKVVLSVVLIFEAYRFNLNNMVIIMCLIGVFLYAFYPNILIVTRLSHYFLFFRTIIATMLFTEYLKINPIRSIVLLVIYVVIFEFNILSNFNSVVPYANVLF